MVTRWCVKLQTRLHLHGSACGDCELELAGNPLSVSCAFPDQRMASRNRRHWEVPHKSCGKLHIQQTCTGPTLTALSQLMVCGLLLCSDLAASNLLQPWLRRWGVRFRFLPGENKFQVLIYLKVSEKGPYWAPLRTCTRRRRQVSGKRAMRRDASGQLTRTEV